MSSRWWWGTYPEAGLGTPTGLGEGLWSMTPGDTTAILALELPAPSFVIAHPDLPILYAVTEEERSTVVCHRRQRTRPARATGEYSDWGKRCLSRSAFARYPHPLRLALHERRGGRHPPVGRRETRRRCPDPGTPRLWRRVRCP